MYHRQGDASKYTFKQIRQLIGEVVAKVPDKQVMSDLDATVKFTARNNGDADKLAITGFCWGGRVVWIILASKQVSPGTDALSAVARISTSQPIQ